jgi:hypothetical protein
MIADNDVPILFTSEGDLPMAARELYPSHGV